jgi:ATP-dependent DNA helicase RecQ
MDPQAVATDVFGVDRLRKEQMEAIAAITSTCAQCVIAVWPTGFGKSLCYQVGTMLLTGFTLVITPLLALCEDQLAFMTAHNIPVQRMDSTVRPDEQRAACARIQSDSCDLKAVYKTPETLRRNKEFVTALRVASAGGRVSFVTIDAAHCVLEWSEFRFALTRVGCCHSCAVRKHKTMQ